MFQVLIGILTILSLNISGGIAPLFQVLIGILTMEEKEKEEENAPEVSSPYRYSNNHSCGEKN
jgi:hypothetical protein